MTDKSMVADNSQEIKGIVEHYKGVKPQLTELLDLFSKINELRRKYADEPTPALVMTQDAAIAKLNSGKYLLEDSPLSINKQIAEKIANDLLDILGVDRQKAKQLEEVFSGLPNQISMNLPELIGRLDGDKKGVNPAEKNIANYILWQILKIFYQNQADRFKSLDYQSCWSRLTCPVCGGIPKISRLQKSTGKRLLACYLCWTEWPVARLVCPYCGNKDQDKLSYFYADGNKTYRVDVCHNCRKYLKTIDEKGMGRESVLELEDVITYHLDTLAINEGYQNPVFFL